MRSGLFLRSPVNIGVIRVNKKILFLEGLDQLNSRRETFSINPRKRRKDRPVRDLDFAWFVVDREQIYRISHTADPERRSTVFIFLCVHSHRNIGLSNRQGDEFIFILIVLVVAGTCRFLAVILDEQIELLSQLTKIVRVGPLPKKSRRDESECENGC